MVCPAEGELFESQFTFDGTGISKFESFSTDARSTNKNVIVMWRHLREVLLAPSQEGAFRLELFDF